jgi:hypothetical protein
MSAVEPLGPYASMFESMEETVDGKATIEGSPTTRRYLGKGGKYYAVAGTDNVAAVSAQLREIVYVLNSVSSAVSFVVMVFHTEKRRIGVAVMAQTFADLFTYSARASGVLVSTVAVDHAKVPAVSGGFPFPNLHVTHEGGDCQCSGDQLADTDQAANRGICCRAGWLCQRQALAHGHRQPTRTEVLRRPLDDIACGHDDLTPSTLTCCCFFGRRYGGDQNNLYRAAQTAKHRLRLWWVLGRVALLY